MRDITVIIPTSPIKSHPSTEIIDETIFTIRHHLPEAEIILTVDGIRDEQKSKKREYNSYISNLLWSCLHKWTNVLPIICSEHLHQSGMLKLALKQVKTPFIMYVEHDTPLTPDRPIDWELIVNKLYSGEAYTVRLHHENILPKEHLPLMIGDAENGFRKTFQWSQRPHVSTTAYYKSIAARFSDKSKTMIEDFYHGIVQNDYEQDGILGWYKHRLWIYYPNDGIQRSYHTDGRQGEDKYSMVF